MEQDQIHPHEKDGSVEFALTKATRLLLYHGVIKLPLHTASM